MDSLCIPQPKRDSVSHHHRWENKELKWASKTQITGKDTSAKRPAWFELWVLVAILDGVFFDQGAAPPSRLRHGDVSWCRGNSPKLCTVLRFGSKPESGITSFINRLVSNLCMSCFATIAHKGTYTSLPLSPWTHGSPAFLMPNSIDITSFAEENGMGREGLLIGFLSTFKSRPWPVWFSR